MSQNAETIESSDSQDDFDPKNSLEWRNAETVARRRRQDCLELLGRDGEFCQGGLLCSKSPFIGPLCWQHYLDELCRPRCASPSSEATASNEAPSTTVTTPTVAPILPPVGGNTTLGLPLVLRPETCHLRDLLLTSNNYLADDDDATSAYDEAGAPPTEGDDVEGQYEGSEADIDTGAVEYEGDEGAMLLLAASIPLPGAGEDEDLEEVDEMIEEVEEHARQPEEREEAGSSFHLPGVNWSWPSEASVASIVKNKADTGTLLRIFPPAQRYTILASGRLECNARARIRRDTGRWEAYDCSTTCERQYDYRRHFLTIHMAGSRWEDVAKQKREHTEDSTSRALVPKKPRAKREPRQAQPLASTSASASTSTAGPPPEVQPKKPRQKRRRQVTEDEPSDDGGYEDRGQSDSDRKGKRARRW